MKEFIGLALDKIGYQYFGLKLESSIHILDCLIEILPSYPDDIPIFHVRITKTSQDSNTNNYNNASKSMEIEVTTKFEYLTKNNEKLLLSLMIYKLQLCFDQYTFNLNNSVKFHIIDQC